MFLGVIGFGTAGYALLLGWSIADALYMTLTTLTTIGFGEVHPLGPGGRAFTMALIVLGVGVVLYGFSLGAQVIMEGEIRNIFRRKRMEKRTASLAGHVIVCGYGRMGRIITEELRKKGRSFVVVEQDADTANTIQDAGYLVIHGDATLDDVLHRARVDRAQAVACVLDSDAKNLYITLSARDMNPKAYVIARCNEESAEKKLRQAGADKVISPYRTGARQMARSILHPNVQDFLEMALGFESGVHLHMGEVAVPASSFLDGKELRDSRLREGYNVMVVGILRAGNSSGDMEFNPRMDARLSAGDIVIALGEKDKMEALHKDLGRGV